jgi:hypothetical protein
VATASGLRHAQVHQHAAHVLAAKRAVHGQRLLEVIDGPIVELKILAGDGQARQRIDGISVNHQMSSWANDYRGEMWIFV